MILIDFQHLSYRNLFTCMYNSKPRKQNGKFISEDFIPLYFYQMLNSLRKIWSDFSDYGEMILLLEGKKNWRKDLVDKYYKVERQKHRDESDINFDEFFMYQKEFTDFLKKYIKVIEVPGLEADDLGFIYSTIKEKSILITTDKDWKQCQIDNLHIDIYDPIKKELYKNSESIQNDLKLFRAVHILIGDKVDGIPSVLYQIEFSDDFKKYLKELKLDIKIPSELEEFIEKNGIEIIENFEGEIYKKPRFGEKTAQKLIASPTEFINKKIKDKKKFYKNCRINRKLVDMRKIPKDLIEKAIKILNETKLNEDIKTDFIYKYNLQKCSDFIINGKKVINYLDDYSDLESVF